MKNTIKALWEHDDPARQEILDRARMCAALTKPSVLPPRNQSSSQKLPENYQSIGSRGVTTLEGRMVMALWPPEVPWFQLQPAAAIRYNPEIPPEVLQEIQDVLYLHELLIQATLESAGLRSNKYRRQSAFRSSKRMAISQLVVTGDTLEQMLDDYRVRVFRRDQYLTKRDSAGDVLYHVVNERIDPLTLSDEQISDANLDKTELMGKDVSDRMEDLYTKVEWQPWTRKWVIAQDLREQKINESEETISPFFSTAFDLSPGEDYGRGFVELNLGDLRTLNELEEKLLDFAAMASVHLIAKDYSSLVRDEDLTKPTGSVFSARVISGQVQDVGLLRAEKMNDFQVVFQAAERKRKDLGGAMLIQSESVRDSERTTKFEVAEVTIRELEGVLGGFYAPLADQQQVPLLNRTIWQLKRDKLLPPIPEKSIDIRALTGVAALSRQIKLGKIMNIADIAKGFGDEALAKLDVGVLMDVAARYQSIYEPGLIKTNEQLAAEQQQALAIQAQSAAQQEAIGVAGSVAENQLTGAA